MNDFECVFCDDEGCCFCGVVNEDEERDNFEAAMRQRFGNSISFAICKNSDGDYLNWDAQVAWFAWQAAKEMNQ